MQGHGPRSLPAEREDLLFRFLLLLSFPKGIIVFRSATVGQSIRFVLIHSVSGELTVQEGRMFRSSRVLWIILLLAALFVAGCGGYGYGYGYGWGWGWGFLDGGDSWW